jgi:hypothetical protein
MALAAPNTPGTSVSGPYQPFRGTEDNSLPQGEWGWHPRMSNRLDWDTESPIADAPSKTSWPGPAEGRVPTIHVFRRIEEDVDGRDKQ